MTRILMLCNNFPPKRGGIARYCHELAIAASNAGNEVTVVAPASESNEHDREQPYRVCRYKMLARPKIPGSGMLGITALIDAFMHLLEIRGFLDEIPYDILHATHFRDIEALALRSYARRTSFIATAYGTEILEISEKKRRTGVLKPFERAVRVAAISEFTRRLLLDRFAGVEPGRVEVVPLGVGQQWFGPVDSESALRSRWGLPGACRVILSVGRLEARKGNHRLIEALKLLPRELQKQLIYVCVGEEAPWEAGYRDSLEQLAREAGFRTIFTGAITDEEIRNLYSVADIFCLPGSSHPHRVEGFGLVLLEAAAQGTASVTTNVGGVPEVVVDGRTGIIVTADDQAELSESIRRLLEDPGATQQLGEAALAHARKMTWDACFERTYHLA